MWYVLDMYSDLARRHPQGAHFGSNARVYFVLYWARILYTYPERGRHRLQASGTCSRRAAYGCLSARLPACLPAYPIMAAYLPARPPACPPIPLWLPICLPACLPACPPAYPIPIHPSHPSIHPLCLYLSIYLSNYPSIYVERSCWSGLSIH